MNRRKRLFRSSQDSYRYRSWPLGLCIDLFDRSRDKNACSENAIFTSDVGKTKGLKDEQTPNSEVLDDSINLLLELFSDIIPILFGISYPSASITPEGSHTIEMIDQIRVNEYEPDNESFILPSASLHDQGLQLLVWVWGPRPSRVRALRLGRNVGVGPSR